MNYDGIDLYQPQYRDCPDFCVNKNGTVPFAVSCTFFGVVDTKIHTTLQYIDRSKHFSGKK
jgi:hypothetical protein